MKRFPATLFLLCLLLLPLCSTSADECCVGFRGNVNHDQDDVIDIADLVYLVNYMFKQGPEPPCPEEADINGDDSSDIADLVYLVNYMFKQGPQPVDCPEPPPPPDSFIVALAIGNEFTGNYTEWDHNGAVVDQGTVVMTVLGDTLIGDSLWYKVADEILFPDTGIVANRDDGLWTYLDTAAVPEALFLKYPATAGESYPYYDLTVKVVSTTRAVTVPAGSYTTYYYEIQAPVIGTMGKIWAAPNLGIVKAELYDLYIIFPYLKTRFELVSYDIQEP